MSSGLKVEHLVFNIESAYAYAQYTYKEIGALKFVTRDVLNDTTRAVKTQLIG